VPVQFRCWQCGGYPDARTFVRSDLLFFRNGVGMRVVLLIAFVAVGLTPASASAQGWPDNERVAFSLSANGYIQENAQPDQTGYGAGLGVLLGHGFTQWMMVLFAVDVGVVNNDAYLARTIGHADLALRVLPPLPARFKPFAHIAFSSQLIEQPASAKDLLRTGFTAGIGVEVPRDANRSFEIGVRRTWLKADDALIQAVDENVYRLHLGLMWRPSRQPR
jgi:hypothetical protein